MEKVHLFHYDGSGYITRINKAINPFLAKKATARSKFCLVPLSNLNPQVLSMNEGERVADDLITLLPVPGHVAIAYEKANGERRYISCRRMFPATKSSLAEYRDTIGGFETFEVFYCPISDAFAFKSHNGLYLHYNDTFGTVAFKACRTGGPEKATWRVLNDGKDEHQEDVPPLMVVDQIVSGVVGIMIFDAMALQAGVVGFNNFVDDTFRSVFGGEVGGDGAVNTLVQMFDRVQTNLEELKIAIKSEGDSNVLKEFSRDVGEGVIQSFSNLDNLPDEFKKLGQAENWSHLDVLHLMTTVNFMAGYVAGKGKNRELALQFAMLTLGFARPDYFIEAVCVRYC